MSNSRKTCGTCRYLKLSDFSCNFLRHKVTVHPIDNVCDDWKKVQPYCSNCRHFGAYGPRRVVGACQEKPLKDGRYDNTMGMDLCHRWGLYNFY